MRDMFRAGVTAVCVAAGLAAVAPRAEAAAYLTAAGWNGALAGATAQYGDVTLSQLPSYTIEYQDSFGTWRPGEPNAAVVGTAGYPYNDPDQVKSRPLFASYSGSTLGNQFSCDSMTRQCLGAYRVTFTFPYEIIGFAGELQLAGDTLLLNQSHLPELQLGDYILTDGYKPGNSTFYGLLLNQPSSSFTLSWGGGAERGFDAFTYVTLANATMVRAGATAVPEPASIALFGVGLAGLAGVVRRRR